MPGFFVGPCSLRAPARREDDDDRARLHPVHEIDDVLVEHADAARRDGLADIFRLVGAVDAVQRVLVALVEVERPRAQRIGRTSGNALRVGAEPRLDIRRRNPVGPFGDVPTVATPDQACASSPTVTP